MHVMRPAPTAAARASLTAVAIAAIAAIAGCSGVGEASRAEPEPREVDAAEFESWRSSRPWSSREELLQFFAERDGAYRARGAVIERPVLQRMAKALSSMFPIGECTRVVYAQGHLRITLDAPQTVPVPGVYHQAFLRLPQELDFRVLAPPEVDLPWRFQVAGAPIRLGVSGLAKFLGPAFLHDFDVDELIYALDDAHHGSTLSLRNSIARHADLTLTVNGHAPADATGTAAFLVRYNHEPDDAIAAHHPPGTYDEDYTFDLEKRRLQSAHVHWQPDAASATASATPAAIAQPPAATPTAPPLAPSAGAARP